MLGAANQATLRHCTRDCQKRRACRWHPRWNEVTPSPSHPHRSARSEQPDGTSDFSFVDSLGAEKIREFPERI